MTDNLYISDEIKEFEYAGHTFKVKELSAREFSYLQDISNTVDAGTGEVHFKPGTFSLELVRLAIVEPKLDVDRLKANVVRDLAFKIQEVLGLNQGTDFLGQS